MNLSTRQMRAFLEVARLGNFTRAAEQAHITQAGLSILIREMERQLGTRLFDRTTRMVSLTSAGQKLMPVVEHLVTELEEVAAQLGAEGEVARQTLRVAATPLVSSHLLPGVFASFRATHPNITLRLFDADLRDVEAMVTSGEADLGLGFFFRAAHALERRAVGHFDLMVVAPAPISGEPSQAPGSAPWSSLRDASLISLPSSNPIQKVIDRQLERLGLAKTRGDAFNFFGTLISMVEAGFGKAIVPTFALAACRRHRVRTDILVKPRVGLDFFRITKRGVNESEALRAFSASLEEALPVLSK